MCKLRTCDFYYGAVISMLNRSEITPTLIETQEDSRRVYAISTDYADYKLLMKYRCKISGKKNNYSSWNFNIATDKDILEKYLANNESFYVALICIEESFNDSKLAILDADQIRQILDLKKESFTISIRKKEQYFRIPKNGKRSEAMMIKCDRMSELKGG